MIKFALNDLKEQELIFREVSQISGISEAIIEKDFWVCFMLDHLFNKSEFKNDIYFKGGTSLSKCYKVIKRFSEDIDLILDWRILGYDEKDLWLPRSHTAQEKFNGEMNQKTMQYLTDYFIPSIRADLEKMRLKRFDIEIDEHDPLSIIFKYPAIYNDNYIKPQVKLELGTLAAKIPIEVKTVTPYIEEYLKDTINGYEFKVNVVSAVRTLFEKMTILHSEANRSSNHPIRYARHYYDTYMLINSPIYQNALNQIKLLKDVVEFNMKFYHSSRSKYNEMLEGNLKLVPSEAAIKVFAADYENMKQMFFGEIPKFNEIMNKIQTIELDFKKLLAKL